MTAEIVGRPGPAVSPHPSLVGRVYGLGSIFGKTLHDSRWSILTIVALIGVMIVAGGGTMASTYGTPETRGELATMSRTLPPVLAGIYGDPLRVDTLGGFISWHYGAYFALLAGLWSILALSSTLAGEAKRGSLDLAAVTPRSRRVLALEKLAGHVVAVAIAMTIVGVLTWLTGANFAKFEGDSIAVDAAFAFAVGVALKALIAGSIAFAIAPILGRGAAAGIAGAVMLAAYLLNSYRGVAPAFDGPANLAWFSWTRGHVPLAGSDDWPSLALVVLVTIILFAVGIEVFARRDIGVTVGVRTPRMPRLLLGVRGPTGRSFGELLPTAVWWGLGLGLYGFVMAVSSTAFIDAIATLAGGHRGVQRHRARHGPDHVGRVPAVRLRRHGPAARRSGRRDLRRGLVVRRNQRPVRAPPHDAAHPRPVGARRRGRRVAGHHRHRRPRGHRTGLRGQRER